MLLVAPGCASSSHSSRPDSTSQSRMAPSSASVATRRPSGLNDMSDWRFVFPARARISWPFLASRTLTVPSRNPTAKVRPCGPIATLVETSFRTSSSCEVSADSSRTISSDALISTVRPSGLRVALDMLLGDSSSTRASHSGSAGTSRPVSASTDPDRSYMPSCDRMTTVPPSELNFTGTALPPVVSRAQSSRPEAKSQSRRLPSYDPLRTVRPSGAKAIPATDRACPIWGFTTHSDGPDEPGDEPSLTRWRFSTKAMVPPGALTRLQPPTRSSSSTCAPERRDSTMA